MTEPTNTPDPWNIRPSPATVKPLELDAYDAGLLPRGDNLADSEWWQDYIRSELGRAHDFYQSQVSAIQPTAPDARVVALREALDNIAHPVKYLESCAKEAGDKLNGGAAIALSKDPQFLRDIARKALIDQPSPPPDAPTVQEAAKVLLDDATALMTMGTAARRSTATDDEGTFPPLFALLDFSGENKTKTVVDAAIKSALIAISDTPAKPLTD